MIYVVKDFPAELCWPSDYLLRAKSAATGRHVVQVGNVDRDRIGFGLKTDNTLFDIERIKAADVCIDRRPFGGAAVYCGPGDVIYSFHINREDLAQPDISAGDLYEICTNTVCETIREFGVSAKIQTQGISRNDGVCVNLEGRSEIVTDDGRKLVGSVYKDDGLIVSVHGFVMLTDAWKKIYDYMKVKPPVAHAGSLKDLIGGSFCLNDFVSLLCQKTDAERIEYTDRELASMKRLVPCFGYERWRG